MNSSQISKIIDEKAVPHPTNKLRLIETHISWVLLGDQHVYKIKKPLAFNFLDFSDLKLRKMNCEREVLLNRRLAPEMYLGVLPVQTANNECRIGGGTGETIDFAVHMRRMDETGQLDTLLESGEVSSEAIGGLARVLAAFHMEAPVIYRAENWEALYEEFRDLQVVTNTLTAILGKADGDRFRMVIGNCSQFLEDHAERIEARKAMGFVKDGHGDLHCRNVFMTQPPVIFDCIEFSEELRTLDILSEIGFLCMDLERYGRTDLSKAFFQAYEKEYPCIENDADRKLFTFYKMYRANVRMKVESLGIQTGGAGKAYDSSPVIPRIKGYSRLFLGYAEELSLLNA